MGNLAIALAFGMSFIFSPGKIIVSKTIGLPLLQSLPSYQGHILVAFINYWIPAILIYLVLRMTHSDKWLKLGKSSNIFFIITNTLFILYISARTYFSTWQGGGASFAVAYYSRFVIYPAIALLLIGLYRLAIASFKNLTETGNKEESKVSAIEVGVVSTIILIPISFATIYLYLLPNAPFRLAYEADKKFEEYCKSAGEKIYEVPEFINSIYVDPDGSTKYGKIKNGIYGDRESSFFLGSSFVHYGAINYFEKKNYASSNDPNAPKFTKHQSGQDFNGEPVNEISSEYAVLQKSLVSEEENKLLKLTGIEVSIVNLKTEKQMAKLVYFVSERNRRICGQTSDNEVNARDFIWRALNLKK